MKRTPAQKAAYDRRVADRICTQCGAGLLDHEITKKCDDCKARNKKKRQSQRRRRADAARARAAYWRDPEARRAQARELKREKKIAKICRDCTLPVGRNGTRCPWHYKIEQQRSSARHRAAWAARKQAA